MATAIALDEQELHETRVRSARQIGLQAVLLGLLADQVLRSAPEGLGWAVWIAALAIASLMVIRYRGERVRAEQVAWLVLAVACASVVAWRASEALQVYNLFATLVALAMFSMASTGKPALSLLSSRVRDLPVAAVLAARDGVLGTFGLLFRDADLGSAVRASSVSNRPMLRAIILTAPVFIVFTALLSRADPVFGAIFQLPEIELETVISHVALAGFFAWISAGWMRGALLSPNRPAWSIDMPLRFGVVEITTSLGTLVALFGLFVGFQLRWLFGGADIVQATTGLSLAEYARRGFFELVTVSALVLPVILGTRALIDDEAALRRHTRLSVALLVLLGAIMTSAVLRMQLYVEYFGLTTDRLFALVFMTWLAVTFVGLSLTVLRGWPRPFAAVTVLSGFATLLGLSVANPDAIVARVNLSRGSAHAVDYAYLARLSGDAAPIVATALRHAPASREACEGARILHERAFKIRNSHLGSTRGYGLATQALRASDVHRLCEGYQPPASS